MKIKIKKNKIFLFLEIILLIIISLTLIKKSNKKDVKLDEIKIGSIIDKESYTGLIIPGELVPIYIEAKTIIEKVKVKEGEKVNKGTKLIEFSKKSLLEIQNKLKLNELDIKNLQLKILDLNSGTLKLELDSRKLEMKKLEQEIKNQNRKLPMLENQAKIYKKLLVEGAGCSLEFSEKNIEYRELKTNLELNKEKYNLMIISYESLKRQLKIEETKINSELMKLNLKNKVLLNLEKQVEGPLLSPINGIIYTIDVTEGSTISPGERLLSISVLGKSKLKLKLLPYQSENLKKGQKAKIIFENSSCKKIYDGVVERVSYIAKSSAEGKRKVVDVEIGVIGKNNLNPGFTGTVEIFKREKFNVPVINIFSVVENNGKYYIYTIDKHNKAVKKEIKVGIKSKELYEVLNLSSGIKIIRNPFKLKEGDKVKVVK